MDSLYAIGAGLALRFVVDFVSDHNLKIGGTLVGIWEGVVLYHFLGKMPRSFDPYVAYGFRLFIDFLFTESLAKMSIVMLWTGLGVLLSDIGPVLWSDSGMRRLYRRAWVRLPRLPLVPKVAIPTRRTVQFWDSPPASSAASDITDASTILPVLPPSSSRLRHRSPSPPLRSPRSVEPRRSLPGRFPGFGSEAETDVSASGLTSTDDSVSDSDTAMPDLDGHMPEIMPEDLPLPIEIDPAFDADTTDSEHTPKRLSMALFPTTDEPYHIIEPDEVQPAIDDVPNIPDDPGASSAHLPIPPMPIVHVPNFGAVDKQIPPMPDSAVTLLDLPPPVPDKLPTVPEGDLAAADDPPPASDNITPPPPAEEWVQVEGSDAPNRRSFADTEISPESVLNGGRNSLLTRADLLRAEAEEEEKNRSNLLNQQKTLKSNGDVKGAFLLQTRIDEAESRVKDLHRAAERRYFHGNFYTCLSLRMCIHLCVVHNPEFNNKESPPTTIDVQHLKVPEAIRRAEEAVRAVLAKGGTLLRVVTDGTVKNSTHLAIIGAMQEWVTRPFRMLGVHADMLLHRHRIFAQQDDSDPKVVVITLPKN